MNSAIPENQAAHHLLDVTNTGSEGLNETTKDFLEQNVEMSQEIQKYDKQLQTIPMIIYMIWLGFFSALLLLGNKPVVFYAFEEKHDVGVFLRVLQLLMAVSSVLTIIACIFVWIGVSKKSLEKIESAVSGFEEFLGMYVFYVMIMMICYFANGKIPS